MTGSGMVIKTAPNFPKIPRISMRIPVIWRTSLLPTCHKSAEHIQFTFCSLHVYVLYHTIDSRVRACWDRGYCLMSSKIWLPFLNNKHRWTLGGGRDLHRCYQRGKLLKLSLISDIKLSAPVKVRYLQTSKGQKWNLNIAFLLEHNTNKKNRTERADLFLSIVLLHHEKSLRSLNVEFEQSLTPGLCHNATANWNNRLLSWGVKRSSEVENITSESGCTDFLFLYLYNSKVVAMWLNASVCSDLFDFLIGTYVSYISFLNLQSVCCLSFFNWPVCPSTYKHCVDLVAFTCIYM